MSTPWWLSFFDDVYAQVWAGVLSPARTAEEAEGLWQLLELAPGRSVLDAPCGSGRLSIALARRGARVVGVDCSASLLARAEGERAEVDPARLRFHRGDLREPLPEGGFDAAFNVFSSLGYGSEQDDRAILRNIASAVRSGGLVLVETMHRDAVARRHPRKPPGMRFDDGTLVVEHPRFDPVTGRVETTYHWAGPRGAGQKSASFRVYSATELVRLGEEAGLVLVSAHQGCRPAPFVSLDDRLGLLLRRA